MRLNNVRTGGLRAVLSIGAVWIVLMQSAYGSGGEDANRVLVRSSVPPAPLSQTASQALEKSRGCLSCHVETDAKTMHESPAVQLGCVDCHGGDATQGLASVSVLPGTPNYMAVLKKAIMPKLN